MGSMRRSALHDFVGCPADMAALAFGTAAGTAETFTTGETKIAVQAGKRMDYQSPAPVDQGPFNMFQVEVDLFLGYAEDLGDLHGTCLFLFQ